MFDKDQIHQQTYPLLGPKVKWSLHLYEWKKPVPKSTIQQAFQILANVCNEVRIQILVQNNSLHTRTTGVNKKASRDSLSWKRHRDQREHLLSYHGIPPCYDMRMSTVLKCEKTKPGMNLTKYLLFFSSRVHSVRIATEGAAWHDTNTTHTCNVFGEGSLLKITWRKTLCTNKTPSDVTFPIRMSRHRVMRIGGYRVMHIELDFGVTIKTGILLALKSSFEAIFHSKVCMWKAILFKLHK